MAEDKPVPGSRHRAGVPTDRRVVASPGAGKTIPDFPPANDPDLDEDGLPKPPDPDRTAQARGVHTDD